MRLITVLQQLLGRAGFIVLVLALVVVVGVVVGVLRRRGALRTAEVVAVAGVCIAVAGVLSLTLSGWQPLHFARPRLYLDPVAGASGWDGIAWRPVIDNVVLFVPVGGLLAAAAPRRSPAAVWAACVALSVAVEAYQYLVPTGRVANTADVLANGLGAALGLVIALVLRARGPRTPSRPADEPVRPVRSSAPG